MDFNILGPIEAVEGGRPLALGGAKQRALLGMLVLHANEVVSSDRLIDELLGG
jgi:DNA-binding SARP family transcriptional activator